MITLFKKTEVITVPYQDFVDFVDIIGPVNGVNIRPGKVRTIVVSDYPRKTMQVIDIVFWGFRRNVNVAKAKLLDLEYSRCNRFS